MAQLATMNKAIAGTGIAGGAAAGGIGLMSVALLGVGAVALGAATAIAGVAAGFLGLGVAGLSIARSVESAFAGVAKTTNGLTDEFGRMNEAGEAVLDQFRELALVKPLPLEDLLRIGELAGQLGIAKESLVGFAAVAADLAVTTDLTVEEASLGLARLGGIFQVSAEDMVENTEKLGSAIVFLGNNFKTTEPEILNFSKRLAAIGKPFGFTQAEILGIGAAVTSAGVESQLGATAIQNTMIAIGNAVASGSDELDFFAEIAGTSADDFARAWLGDAPAAFIDFVKGIADQGQNFEVLLDEVGLASDRTVRALIPLSATGDDLERAIGGASLAFGENIALTREATIRYATFDSQLILLKNRFRDTGLEIGNVVKDALGPFLQSLIPIVDQIRDGIVPAFEAVFKAVTEQLLPAFNDLLIAFGFDVEKADLTQGLINFGDFIAEGIEGFSDFVVDVADLVTILKEGGISSLLEHFGIEEDTAQTITDVGAAVGIAAISFIALKNALAGFAVVAGTIATITLFFGELGAALALLPGAIGAGEIGLALATLASVFTGAIPGLLLIAVAALIGVIAVFGERAAEALGKLTIILLIALTEMQAKLFDKIKERLQFELQGLADSLNITEEMKERWRQIWEDIKAIGEIILVRIINGILLWIEDVKESLRGDTFANAAQEAWEKMRERIAEKSEEIRFNISQDIIRWINEVKASRDKWVQAGKDVIQGLLDGLTEEAREVIKFVTDLAEEAIRILNRIFDNRSPSGVFEDMGKNLMEGLALGIARNMNLPQVALDAAGANIMSAGQGVVNGAAIDRQTNVDRSFNAGGMTFNTQPESPNRVVDDLALLAQLA